MAKVNIGACRVKAELYTELAFIFGGISKFFGEFGSVKISTCRV